MNLATAIIGPLLVPEVSRQARRGWVLIVRTLAALMIATPAMAALWWWWMNGKVDPQYRAYELVPTTLGILEGLLIAIVLVLSPAILAGSLAGEKERGSIGLLLSTSVDAREIVLGRMLGKLSSVVAILLAGFPFLLGFAVLADHTIGTQLALLALPFAVGLGVGGMAIAASAVARKGRNALMAIYVVELLLLLVPLLGLAPGLTGLAPLLGPLNPFEAIEPLLRSGSGSTALPVLLMWSTIGLLGVAIASWRLRLSFLALVGGKARGLTRRFRVPALDEARPILWKELHIERIGALGWFGRVLGVLVLSYLVVGSLVLACLAIWTLKVQPNASNHDVVITTMDEMFGDPGFLFSWLILLTVGLRAAVAISSERERGTWDALLTSPLTGREILVGKLWGSLYAMRWLLIGTILAWGLSLGCGAITLGNFLTLVGQTVVISAFAAALGVRASLSCATATRAMTLTVGILFGTFLLVSLVAAIVVAVLLLLCFLTWLMANPLGLVSPGGRPWIPVQWAGTGWKVMVGLLYISLTSTIIAEARNRFDQIAGRTPAGGEEPPRPRPHTVDQFDDGELSENPPKTPETVTDLA
ncbi:MAG: hypothetical protein JWN86_4461 [Planctomycetota bacterium]|nr:hypothetical protein [Planctomycetota bacterium]